MMIMFALALATAASGSIADHRPPTSPEAKTAGAVIAADDAWSAAEERGDAVYVDWLLMPDYKSVSPDGSVHVKAAILKSTQAQADPTRAAARVAADAAWRVAHPSRIEVSIVDDTAVLTSISTKPGEKEPISSCDVFVYRDGHWHGVYSQHSTASA